MDRRIDEDELMGGLTRRQARGMLGKVLSGSNEDLFRLERKNAVAMFIEDEAMNPLNSLEERVLCVDKLLKMQGLNLDYQKMVIGAELAVMKGVNEAEEGREVQPEIVLILPPNGSEVEKEPSE